MASDEFMNDSLLCVHGAVIRCSSAYVPFAQATLCSHRRPCHLVGLATATCSFSHAVVARPSGFFRVSYLTYALLRATEGVLLFGGGWGSVHGFRPVSVRVRLLASKRVRVRLLASKHAQGTARRAHGRAHGREAPPELQGCGGAAASSDVGQRTGSTGCRGRAAAAAAAARFLFQRRPASSSPSGGLPPAGKISRTRSAEFH